MKLRIYKEMPNLNSLEEYQWVKDMQDCMQDSIWHGEGDVWTHTKMVLEALISLPEYNELSDSDKFILQWSVIFHDVAKPITTEIDENGRVTSPRHAKIGEKVTREILWDNDIETREKICSVVRLHGLPIWAINKDLPIRQVILSSQRISNKLLYIFAKADMLGRICDDLEENLLRVELFKELCIDANAWESVYEFENDHSKFRFFLKSEEYPGIIYDDTEFEIVVLSGIAGSGKDTYASKLNLPMISLDDIRKELGIKATDKKAQGKVAQLAYERAKRFAANKQSFIWNSTNITSDMRMRLLQKLSVYNPKFKMVYLETSYEDVIKHRSAYIPKNKLDIMFQILDIPLPYEAHELVLIKR